MPPPCAHSVFSSSRLDCSSSWWLPPGGPSGIGTVLFSLFDGTSWFSPSMVACFSSFSSFRTFISCSCLLVTSWLHSFYHTGPFYIISSFLPLYGALFVISCHTGYFTPIHLLLPVQVRVVGSVGSAGRPLSPTTLSSSSRESQGIPSPAFPGPSTQGNMPEKPHRRDAPTKLRVQIKAFPCCPLNSA